MKYFKLLLDEAVEIIKSFIGAFLLILTTNLDGEERRIQYDMPKM